MKKTSSIALVNLIIILIVGMHNNCSYRADSQVIAQDSTIIGNPFTVSKIATFTPKSTTASVSVCVIGYTLQSSLAKQVADFANPQHKILNANGAQFDEVPIVPGTYTQVKMRLADKCNTGYSISIHNSWGDFFNTQEFAFNFTGDVIFDSSKNLMTFNIQSIIDLLEEVQSDKDIVDRISISGLVSTPDLWASLNLKDSPEARNFNASAWTGRELIVWGGYSTGVYFTNGGIYDPTRDTWRTISEVNAPSARLVSASVWTGTHMIVWGGEDFTGTKVNTGAMYDPQLNHWFTLSTINAPSARVDHTAVWTGQKLIVWGGESSGGSKLNSGGIYDPQTNSWSATSTLNAPTSRAFHSAIWTGTEMIIWGGCEDNSSGCQSSNPGLNTGARYNPTTDTWKPINNIDAPTARFGQNTVWTGSEMIVWSGNRFEPPYGSFLAADGGKYNPTTDTWSPVASNDQVKPRVEGVSVWTGSKMLIWGGRDYNFKDINTSALYDPVKNEWQTINPQNAPSPRRYASGYWTGFEIIIWGGWQGGADYLNSGGRYRP